MTARDIPPYATRARMAAEFDHPDVVSSYRYRPEYPAQTFEILTSLLQQLEAPGGQWERNYADFFVRTYAH